MKEIFIETKRLIISPLTESNYENITKLYSGLKNDGIAVDVFGKITEDEVEKGFKFVTRTETGFNLMAKLKDEKDFVGYLKGYLLEGRGLWIYTLAVVESFRRKGYGRELISAVSDYMRVSYGINFICLSVVDSNKTAKNFWEALGFKSDKILIKSGLVKDELSKINIYAKHF